MEMKVLLHANCKKHKRNMAGIFALVLFVTVSLASALTIWLNAGNYIRQEMERLKFGELTLWTAGTDAIEEVAEKITSMDEVEEAGIQNIIYAEYQIGEQKSDSEGQLIQYEPERYDYRVFQDNLSEYQENAALLQPGEIYVAASMQSMFGLHPGDSIEFPIARNGVNQKFTVKGYYEDPFMGSSMIGMKGFLICEEDMTFLKEVIAQSGIHALARSGEMIHVLAAREYEGTAAQLNQSIHEETDVQSFLEFSHSSHEMYGFMMTFQNVFVGIFLAFVLTLYLVTMVVCSYSMTSAIEQDTVNMGILKTIGLTGVKLREIQLLQYLISIAGGMAAGLLLSLLTTGALCSMTVTTIGVAVPDDIPLGGVLLLLAILLGLLMGFIWCKTMKIEKIRPMDAIARGLHVPKQSKKKSNTPIRQKNMVFWMAVRQVMSAKKRYVSICMVSALLVLFASLLGRVNAWLGPEGKGLMDAFNPADLHIAAQPVGNVTPQDVEQLIQNYTTITDQYMLAMPSVAVEGMDMTANVITEPERFHMLEGQAEQSAGTVVLTEYVAADLEVGIGDRLTITGNRGSEQYTVTGIYQCANDMGQNIGMSRAAYARISQEAENIWCYHFFIEDVSRQPEIVQGMEAAFGGDIYIHENSWPGLFGILSAMKLLMYVMYGVVAAFILVVTLLVTGRLLSVEQADMGIYRSMGLKLGSLRSMFTLRFGMVSLVGALLGMMLGNAVTDPLVAVLMRRFGISNFSSDMELLSMLLPVAVVVLSFSLFAWCLSGGMKKMDLILSITEQ
jgi:putative ABC transport system permease protein